jgi:sugar lactone lactonase YvrE
VIDNGTVTTLAGTGSSCTSNCDHATGTSAGFNNPIGITTDGTNLYVAEHGMHRIRKIVIDNGTVTTIAGTGSACTSNCDHATGTSAGFSGPGGITTDGTNLYVVDDHKHRIRKIVIDNGTVTTLAGTGSACSSNCDNATGTSAGFNNPWGITTDGTNLYVADYGKHRIRKIVIDNGTVTTIAGTGSACSSDCDNATGTSAGFYGPIELTTDGTNLYVADYGKHRIRKIE